MKILGVNVTKNANVDDVMCDIPVAEGAYLDSMVRRDNFFHNCWMNLKLKRPDLWTEMSRVELLIGGYDPDAPTKAELEAEMAKEKDLPDRTIL